MIERRIQGIVEQALARQAAVALVGPRQVGKTFWVGAMIVALCTLFPGLTVLWTAHRTRTATRTFG